MPDALNRGNLASNLSRDCNGEALSIVCQSIVLASSDAALASGGNGHRPEQLLVPGVPGGLSTDQKTSVCSVRLQEGAMVNQVLTRILRDDRAPDYHSKPTARYKCWLIARFGKLNHLTFDASSKTQEL